MMQGNSVGTCTSTAATVMLIYSFTHQKNDKIHIFGFVVEMNKLISKTNRCT